MKNVLLIIIIILVFTFNSRAMDIQKFYAGDKKEIFISRISDDKLNIDIYKINQPENALFHQAGLKEKFETISLDPIIQKLNFFQKITAFFKKLFNIKKLYDYRIEFSSLSPGLYHFVIKGNSFSRNLNILISRYRLISKMLYNSCNNFVINTSRGMPVQQFKLNLIYDDLISEYAPKKDYFYKVPLDKKTCYIMVSVSNQFDINKISPDIINPENPDLYLEFFLPKTYFTVGDNLAYTVILKEKNRFSFSDIPLSRVDISLLDENRQVIKSKIFNDVTRGYIHDAFSLDDLFKEGIYYIRANTFNKSELKYIYILNKYNPGLIFRVSSDRSIYYFNDTVKLDINVINKFGNYSRNCDLTCDVLYKELNSKKIFQYLTTLKTRLKKGRHEFKLKIAEIFKHGNYDVKVIIKVKNNNGYQEAEYHTFKILNSDFDIKIINDYNIFEVDSPISFNYELLNLNSGAEVKGLKFSLFKVNNLNTGEEFFISSEKLQVEHNKIELSIDKSGYYRAQIELLDNHNRTVKKDIFFWVLSYTYGIEINEKLKEIIIVQNKKEYEYSDIGKIMVLFPKKKLWYNLYIEGHETYYNKMEYSEKNNIVFDFPIYEKYSPEVILKVIAFDQTNIYFNRIKLKIPYISKYLKFNAKISNIKSNEPRNSIDIEPSNYWGHALNSYIFLYTVNRDFTELYNQYNEDLHGKLFTSVRNSAGLINVFFKKREEKTAAGQKAYFPGYLYHDCMYDSLNNYKVLYLQKQETSHDRFNYKKKGYWTTYLKGFTEDLKIGFNSYPHHFKQDYSVTHFVPEYLSLKDETDIYINIRNYMNINFKFRLDFNILNGKYQSSVNKFVMVEPNNYKELYLQFQPVFKSTSKIRIKTILPTKAEQKDYFIRLVTVPEIKKLKNKDLSLKKYYYKLYYREKEGRHYSSFKRAGWFQYKYFRGEDALIGIRLKVKKEMKNIYITDYIPGGFEYISNKWKYHIYGLSSIVNHGIIHKGEKITFHIPELKKGVYYIYYLLKPKFKGRYFLPGLTALENNKIICSYPENRYILID